MDGGAPVVPLVPVHDVGPAHGAGLLLVQPPADAAVAENVMAGKDGRRDELVLNNQQ